jgi:hypothetical protein
MLSWGLFQYNKSANPDIPTYTYDSKPKKWNSNCSANSLLVAVLKVNMRMFRLKPTLAFDNEIAKGRLSQK